MSENLARWRSFLRGVFTDAPDDIKAEIRAEAGRVMAATFPSLSRKSEMGRKVYGNMVMKLTAERCGLEEEFRRVVFAETEE